MGVAFLLNFVRMMLLALELLVLARVLLSWVDPAGRNPVAGFIVSTTEPILGPVRKLLPRTGMIDFSPLLVIVVLGMLLRAVG